MGKLEEGKSDGKPLEKVEGKASNQDLSAMEVNQSTPAQVPFAESLIKYCEEKGIEGEALQDMMVAAPGTKGAAEMLFFGSLDEMKHFSREVSVQYNC